MAMIKDELRKRTRRPIEKLNLIDDFLFQQMLQDDEDAEEFCRILLGTILGRTVRNVRIVPQKAVLGADTDKHGIRLDAYIEEISGEGQMPGVDTVDAKILPDIYDIEPNNKYEKATLPKRMRYYHGLIDSQLLSVSTDYSRLQNVVVIMILPYDPFDQNRVVYTVQNQCVEAPEIPYDDGAKKIFLYTNGTKGNASQNLRDMLKYIEETTDNNVTNQDINAIHQIVQKVKHKKEVGIRYMKSWEHDAMCREEGLQEGLQLGLREGIEALISTCQEFKLSREETVSRIREKLSLDAKTAEEYMQKYWH